MRTLASTNSSARRAGAHRRTLRSRLSYSLGLVALLSGLSVTALAAATATTSAASTTRTVRAPAAPVAGGLSGTWKGTYRGSASGKFVVTLNQSGTRLSGSIVFPPTTKKYSVTGTVNGSSIQFGTVGPKGKITYTGSVSGKNSMSGTWKDGTAHGTWSATRS